MKPKESKKSQLLTIGQVKTIRQNGGTEFVTRDALIQPDRYKFANPDELTAYLGQVAGGKPDGGGIRGSVSRKGTYSRRAADGTHAVTFGDPVLDAVSSAAGTLVLGDRTIDLKAGDGASGSTGPSGGVVVFDAPDLKFTGIVNGAERWASDDHSMVEYRLGNGRLIFHAWKKSTLYGYWSMGGEISVLYTDTHFEAAEVFELTFMTVLGKPPCAVYNDHGGRASSALNDSYVDQYDWGWNSQQPEQVAAACLAQWHHARFRDVLIAGEGCQNAVGNQHLELLSFPPEWDTIKTLIELNGNWTDGSTKSAIISVQFKSITVDMSEYGRPAAQGSVGNGSTITVTFPDDRTYTGTLQPPNTIRWSNGSVWTKIINTVMDLNGMWTDGVRKAIISEGPQAIAIDMSDYDRPAAHGSIVNGSTITVNFPDDATYTGTLQAPNTIRWSNGSAWTKV